jgi:26S proteasome non-ATPase regulatory subunit 9
VGPLVDAEGFPIPGVDLYAVCAQRQEVARLRTDIARLSREMEAALEQHTAAQRVGGGGGGGGGGGDALGSGCAARPGGAPPPPPCLALLGEVAPGGPAAEAGLQPGDFVCAWGGLAGGCGAGLRELALSARACCEEGRPLSVRVLRAGVERAAEVRPRAWAGAGILGCRLLEVPKQKN